MTERGEPQFRVSWSPASEFERALAEHGDAWPDYLPKIEPVTDSREKALAYIERIGGKALHGHFVLTEFETDVDGNERELSREVFEARGGAE
jgi:hypothetical protein